MKKQAAKEREKTGKSADEYAGGRGRKKPYGNLPEGLEGETREKVATAVGMKARTYEKAAATGKGAKASGSGKLPEAVTGGKLPQHEKTETRQKVAKAAQIPSPEIAPAPHRG